MSTTTTTYSVEIVRLPNVLNTVRFGTEAQARAYFESQIDQGEIVSGGLRKVMTVSEVIEAYP